MDKLLLTSHFKPINNKYNRATLCGLYNENNNKYIIQFGVSFCNKKDQFVRKEGRIIAGDRAYISPYKVIEFPNKMTKRELLDFLYVEVFRISKNPSKYIKLQCKKIN